MAELLFKNGSAKKTRRFKMSFLETLLDGTNEKERKNKAACAAAIAITAILLVIAIIAFSICLIIDSTPSGPNDNITSERKIESVEQKAFGGNEANAVKEGLLITLNDGHPFTGTPSNLSSLQNRTDRPKVSQQNSEGTYDNAYTVLNKDVNLAITEETGKALNEMLKAFYNATKNEYLIISDAYNIALSDSQDSIFSAGTVVELKYFSTPPNYATKDTIAGVNEFKWLYNNAHRYGFIALSEDSNLFRYVGTTFATAIKNSGLSFDAYTAKLKEATYENPVFLDAAKNYATYYCPINNVLVPTDYAYDTDGDNVGGVYVTVDFTKPKNS